MNDRFKFRVYIKAHNKMCDVHTLHTGTNKVIVSSRYGNHSVQINEYNILMQCTGLKDKNGKLIYEGDICEYEFEDIGKQKAIIYFNNKYASFLKKPLNDFQYAEINDCKVIGNIYQDSHLLEN